MERIELKHGQLCSNIVVYYERVQIRFIPNKYVEEKTLRNWFEYRFPKKQLTNLLIKHLFAAHHGDVARGLKKGSISLIQDCSGDWAIQWEWTR